MPLLNNGKVIFCDISNKDSFSDKYQIVVGITEEQAADAEDAGLSVKTKEFDGKMQWQVGFKTKFKILHNIRAKDGQTIVDLEGGELARGSVVNVAYSMRNWVNPQTKAGGVSQDLTGVQILEQATGGMNEFGDASEFSAAGGDSGDM